MEDGTIMTGANIAHAEGESEVLTVKSVANNKVNDFRQF
jgi:hypothetical protein